MGEFLAEDPHELFTDAALLSRSWGTSSYQGGSTYKIILLEVIPFLDAERSLLRIAMYQVTDRAHVAFRPIGLTLIIPLRYSINVPLPPTSEKRSIGL